jgi:uncharacterized protein
MALLSTTGKAPGVYIQEITVPGPLSPASTNILAIVGPSKKGPLNTPILLTNIDQFWNIFGDYIEDPYRVYAAHAVNGFFAEGGTACYFTRVGNGAAASLNLSDRATSPQTTLIVTALQEGNPTVATTVAVADASLAATTVQKAQATIATTDASKLSITVTAAGDLANFLPGDSVHLDDGTHTDNTVIASKSGTTVTFQTAILNAYTGGTVRIADIPAGATQLRVADTTKIEPGSYVSIAAGATIKEWAVVRLVNPLSKVIGLTNPLTNAYSLATADPAINVASAEFTLTIVSPNAGTETFANLSMDSRHSRYFDTIVTSKAVSVALPDMPSTTPPQKNLPAVLAATPLAGGANDNLSTLTTSAFHTGIDKLKKISDVSLLCVPDAVGSHFTASDTQDIQAYMIQHCQRMLDRFAILDSRTWTTDDTTFATVTGQRATLNSDGGYAALYFPWIGISNPLGSGTVFVPPSGHTAGVFANTDNTIGVYKAPANEAITSALSLQVSVTDDEQGPLNDLGVNVIRSFKNDGIKIWGARTIAPPDVTAWRFVNVRRLLIFIEKTIQDGTRFAVFEPNNLTLWQQIKRIVGDFLMDQYTGGALFGVTPDQAFRVRVDATLNPPDIRAQGILVVEVTVVPTTPAEFIIFQVVQDITGSTLQEQSS